MTKHTPGPWEWQTSNSWRRLGSARGDGDVMYPCVQRDGHPDVTFKNGGVEGPDARLIAAAPDLYKALERIAAIEIERGMSGGEAIERGISAVGKARAALAKASA